MPIDSEKIKLTFEITNQKDLDKILKNVHTIKIDLKTSNSGELKKIENLRDKGITVPVRLNLFGQDFNLVQKWEKQGIVIKTKFEGLPSPAEINKMYSAMGSAPRSSQPAGSPSSGLILPKSYQSDMDAASRKVLELKKGEGQQLLSILEGNKKLQAAQDKLTNAYITAASFIANEDRSRPRVASSIGLAGNSLLPNGMTVDEAKKMNYSGSIAPSRNPGIATASTLSYRPTGVGSYSLNTPHDHEVAAQEIERLRIRQEQLLEEKQQLQHLQETNRAFRQRRRLEDATNQVNRSPKFIGFDDAIEEAAFKHNVNPEFLRRNLQSQQQPVSRSTAFDLGFTPTGPNPLQDRRRLFDLNRVDLKDPEIQRELGFAGLFGGPTALLGGVAGAAVGGAPGAFLGSTIAQVGIENVARILEQVAESLHRVGEAGLRFNESILGISATLQATTKITGSNGSELPFQDQVQFQQGRARDIQLQARAKLLPIGIAGEREATLVQSIVSGAAQRGIQLSPEQAATIAERIGGAIQAQRPELLNNPAQLRRDIEDLLSGLPNRTVLSSLIKGFAPGLGKATTGEELISASGGLSQFPAVLAGSKNNPVVAFQQLNSAIDNLSTTVGDSLVKSLIPGINALSSALSNPELTKGLSRFVDFVGKIASFTAREVFASTNDSDPQQQSKAFRNEFLLGPVLGLPTFLGRAIEGFDKSGQEFSKAFSPKKEEDKKVEIRAETSLNNLLRRLGSGGEALNVQELAEGKNTPLAKKLNSRLLGGLITSLEKERLEEFDKIKDEDLLKNPEIQKELEKGKDKQSVLSKFRKRGIEAIQDEITSLRFGSNIVAQQNNEERAQELLGLIDQSTTAGKLSAIDFQRDRIPRATEEIQKDIASGRDIVSTLQSRIKSAEADGVSEEGVRSLKVELGNAIGALEAAEIRLIQKRKEEIGLIDQTGAALQSRIDKERRAVNSNNFVGQGQLIGLERKSIGVDSRTLESRRAALQRQLSSARSQFEADDILNQLSEVDLDSNILGNRSNLASEAEERLDVDRAGAIFSFNKLNRDDAFARRQFSITKESQGIQGREIQNAFKQTAITFEELNIKGKGLQGAIDNATNALNDFGKDANLRKLGRKGQLIAAADAALQNGSSEAAVADLLSGTGVSVSDVTEPSFRESFQRELGEEQLRSLSNKFQPGRVAQDEKNQTIELQNAKEFAELGPQRLEAERENLRLTRERNALAKRQLELDIERAEAAEKERNFGVDQEKFRLGKQFSGDNSPKGIEIRKEGEAAYQRLLKEGQVEEEVINPYDTRSLIQYRKDHDGNLPANYKPPGLIPLPGEVMDEDNNPFKDIQIPPAALSFGATSGEFIPLAPSAYSNARFDAIRDARQNRKYKDLQTPKISGSDPSNFVQGQLDAYTGYVSPLEVQKMIDKPAPPLESDDLWNPFKSNPRVFDGEVKSGLDKAKAAINKANPGENIIKQVQDSAVKSEATFNKMVDGIASLIRATTDQTQKLPQAVAQGLNQSFGN